MLALSIRRPIAVAALAAASVVASGATHAIDLNGFQRAPGHGDVSVSYTSESYDSFWRGEEKVMNPGVGEVDTTSVSVFLAYGLTDRLTLFAELPYVDAEGDGTAGFFANDLSDLTALASYRVWGGGESRHSLLCAAGIRTIASNYVADAPVSVGDGTADWLARVVYQYRGERFYVSQQVGLDVRGGDAPDGIPLYTEAGLTWRRATFIAFYSQLVADGGTDIGDPGFTFPSNQEEWQRGGLKAYVEVGDGFGVSLSSFTTFDGRNTGDATGFSLGLTATF